MDPEAWTQVVKTIDAIKRGAGTDSEKWQRAQEFLRTHGLTPESYADEFHKRRSQAQAQAQTPGPALMDDAGRGLPQDPSYSFGKERTAALGRELAYSLPLGVGDELAAFGGAVVSGRPYQDIRAEQTERRQAQDPGASIVGNVLGGLPADVAFGGLLSRATQGMKPLSAAATAIGSGVGASGVLAATNAPEGQRGDAALRAMSLTSMLGGALMMPAAYQYGRNTSSMLWGNPTRTGTPLREAAVDEIRRLVPGLSDNPGALPRRATGVADTPADMSTEAQLLLERQLRRTSDETAGSVRNQYRARTTGPIVAEARSGLTNMGPGGTRGLVGTQKAGEELNRRLVNDAYESALGSPLAQSMTPMEVQNAVHDVADHPFYQMIVERLARNNPSTVNGPVTARHLNQIDKLMGETVQAIRMGERNDLILDDAIEVHERFRNILSEKIPGYGEAVSLARSAFRQRDAFDLGRSWTQRSAEDIAEEVARLEPGAQQAYKDAASARIFSDFSRAINSQDVSNKAVGTFLDELRKQDQKLRAIFGPQADNFITELRRLQEQSKTARTIINSSQAERAADAGEQFRGQIATAFGYALNAMRGAAGRTVIQSMMHNPMVQRNMAEAITDIMRTPQGFGEIAGSGTNFWNYTRQNNRVRGLLQGTLSPAIGGLLGGR